MKPIDLIALREILKDLDQNSVVLDVRTDAEFQEKRLEGTLHIPIQELPLRISEITAYSVVITHCAHGARAKKAALFLSNSSSFKEIYYVDGDIEDWEESDLKVLQG